MLHELVPGQLNGAPGLFMSNLRTVVVSALAGIVALDAPAAQSTSAKSSDSPVAEARIGVAASRRGQVCVAMPGPPLIAGSVVTLIEPNRPQSVRVVTIDGVGACPVLAGAMIAEPYYSIRPFDSEPTVWVAVPGKPGTRRIGPGVVAVRLTAAQPAAQVRTCTSTEGLHLTVWAGAPLRSRRLWHQYFYLGYDVEPSCEDRDVGDRPGDRSAP
jgi:hypothetical protein